MTKRKKIMKYRNFNGKRYVIYGPHRTKAKAKKVARRLRKGHSERHYIPGHRGSWARVIKRKPEGKPLYFVYTRRKQR